MSVDDTTKEFVVSTKIFVGRLSAAAAREEFAFFETVLFMANEYLAKPSSKT